MRFSQASSKKIRRPGYRWTVFVILSLQYLLVYFHRVSPALMTRELVAAFSISGASLGLLSSSYFYAYALMQLPVGIFADRWGARKTITLFSAIGAVGAILFGLAPNFQVATAARVLVGLGLSAVFVPAMRVCASLFSAREYAAVSGLLLAMGGVGWFVAATPLTWMTALFGWRGTFTGIGVLTILLATATWFLVVEEPSQSTRAGDASGKHQQSVWAGLRLVLSTGRFWPLAGWFFFFGGILFGFCGLWAGPYLMDVCELSKSEAGNVLSMIALGTIVGGPLLGRISDRMVRRRKSVICFASLMEVLLMILVFSLKGRLPYAALFPIFFLFGIFGNGIAVVAFAAAKELFALEIAGTAVGSVNFFAFISAAIYQPLSGLIMDMTGRTNGGYPPEAYTPVLFCFLITSILLLICISLFREESRPND
ncbi:MFS transporter [Desulfosarcina widdelii]|uniref:Lysosomal dipeptide transporter MFSD1 n=2 Tax=Desulfosarcina widdelii TaxID=947919 RepID=A0A5K7Z0E4_9BACT|nr:MFS transporter [Desulfosarcina widdelii]